MHRAVMKPPVNAGLFTPFTGIELVKKYLFLPRHAAQSAVMPQ